MTTLDLDAMLANHVEGPLRRSPAAGSTCRACHQLWPCDASMLAAALIVSEARFAVLESGATVLVRFTPGRLTRQQADRIKAHFVERRPDVDWLVIEADEIVGFNPQPERLTHARCHEEGDRSQADEEGREEDTRRKAT